MDNKWRTEDTFWALGLNEPMYLIDNLAVFLNRD